CLRASASTQAIKGALGITFRPGRPPLQREPAVGVICFIRSDRQHSCPLPLLRGGTRMTTTTVESRETANLIGSDKDEGTTVYGADSNKIGSIQRVMLDKISGKVAYAVMSFGGFLGMGEDYYPIPWPMLKYDTNLGGYRINLTNEQLDRAPKYTKSTDWNWS